MSLMPDIRDKPLRYRELLLTYAQLMEQNRTESVGRDTDYHNVPLLLRKSVSILKPLSQFILTAIIMNLGRDLHCLFTKTRHGR